MSEQYLSTRSETCMHLKKLNFFLVSASQIHISGTQQGHQRAGALLGSLVVIQKTFTAVNGVEHQKTLTTKNNLENGIFGIQKSS